MHTINIQLNDDLYETLSSNNIDIQSKIKEYLSTLVDDGYTSISNSEAKKRVTDAVNRYNTSQGNYNSLNN
ncbi:MAG: hypothetical protein RBS32_08365, partial [Aliarcobacter sp.]|nr:hypothetical protein [Aliarcobacter sp.]